MRRGPAEEVGHVSPGLVAAGWPRLRRLLLPLATLVLVAGVSVGVAGAGLGSAAALVTGVAAGMVAGGLLAWVRERRAMREAAAAEREAEAARREAAWRLFWEASSDLQPGAWGRRDLETLRLLVLNLEPGQVPGPRLAARLRDASSRVLAGAVDRCGDLLVTVRQLVPGHRALPRLEEGVVRLVDQLEGEACLPGQPVPFDPATVARACTLALEACDLLRRELGGRVVADLRAVLAWLARERHDVPAARGEIVFPGPGGPESPPGSGRLLVVARPADLVAALDEALSRALAYGDPVGPVRVDLAAAPDARVAVTIAWRTADRLAVEPRKILQPLLLLRAYGGEVRVEEDPGEDRIALRLEVDPAGAAPAEGGAVALPG